jgi:hypothetical protein
LMRLCEKKVRIDYLASGRCYDIVQYTFRKDEIPNICQHQTGLIWNTYDFLLILDTFMMMSTQPNKIGLLILK